MPPPSTLPLFPLPNVVLFPQVLLPLHIFEPRYRQMVKDAAAGDELIGMILLRRPEGQGDPSDIYSVGCAGRMIRKVELPDGRSNILLQGAREFIVREQSFDRPYRTGVVEWRPPPAPGFRLPDEIRRTLEESLHSLLGPERESELRLLADPTLGDELRVNLFAFALDLPMAEKQSLLEVADLSARAERLVETLEFHVLERACVPGAEALKSRVQ